jgi:inner membrane protein
MPTIITHAAVPLALGLGLGRRVASGRLVAAGVLASMLPDIDVLGFHWHIAYADTFGHRGASHSLMFALLLGVLAMSAAKYLQTNRLPAFLFVSACAASHGLLDMLTNGGLGVAFLWPFTDRRLFFPWRTIEVAPFGLHVFSDPRGLAVLWSELRCVWLPAAVGATLLYVVRRQSGQRAGAIE